MCPSGATCLPVDCFGLVHSGHHYHLIACNLFSPWHNFYIGIKQQSLTHYSDIEEMLVLRQPPSPFLPKDIKEETVIMLNALRS